MKKILAIMMAIVMMMAIAIPSFATKTLDSAASAGDTDVIVDGTNGGTYEGSYIVTIPASVDLTWGENGEDYYYITSQLATDKRVQVTLAKSVDLTAGANVIPFTATDTTNGLSRAEVVADEDHKFEITIDPAEWLDVPYDVYEGQISFTSEVVDV